MSAFAHVATLVGDDEGTLSTVTDLEMAFEGGALTLVAADRGSGTVSVFDAAGFRGAVAVSRPGPGGEIDLSLVEGGGTVLVGGATDGTLHAFGLAGAGPAPIGAAPAGSASGRHVAVETGGALRVYGVDAGGALGGAAGPHSGALAAIADTAGTDFGAGEILAASGAAILVADASGTVASYLADGSGALAAADRLDAEDGLWVSAPSALETVGDFVVLGAAGSASLSVMHVSATGGLTLTDHVIDDRGTRFDDVSALASARLDGRDYLFAAGSDGGISLLELRADGTLVHLEALAGTAGLDLWRVSAMEAVVRDGAITLMVARTGQDDIAELRVAPAVATHRDGAGSETLHGTAGADIFVFGADGQADTVQGFDRQADALDLSHWGMLRDVSQLEIVETAAGARLTYRGEVLTILAADGAPVTAAEIAEAGILPQSRLSVPDVEIAPDAPTEEEPPVETPGNGDGAPPAPVEGDPLRIDAGGPTPPVDPGAGAGGALVEPAPSFPAAISCAPFGALHLPVGALAEASGDAFVFAPAPTPVADAAETAALTIAAAGAGAIPEAAPAVAVPEDDALAAPLPLGLEDDLLF